MCAYVVYRSLENLLPPLYENVTDHPVSSAAWVCMMCVCVYKCVWTACAGVHRNVCVCVWCVNVTDHPISSTWLPMLASTCLCAQIFSVGNCILRLEERTGALWVGGHLTPQNCTTVLWVHAAVTQSHYTGTSKKVRSQGAMILTWCIWH